MCVYLKGVSIMTTTRTMALLKDKKAPSTTKRTRSSARIKKEKELTIPSARIKKEKESTIPIRSSARIKKEKESTILIRSSARIKQEKESLIKKQCVKQENDDALLENDDKTIYDTQLTDQEVEFIIECIDDSSNEAQHVNDKCNDTTSIVYGECDSDMANPALSLQFLNNQYSLYKLKIIVLISSVLTNLLVERCKKKCKIANCNDIIDAIQFCMKNTPLKKSLITVHHSLRKLFYKWHHGITNLMYMICNDCTPYNLFVLVDDFNLKNHIKYLQHKKLNASIRHMEIIYLLMKPLVKQVMFEITQIYIFEIPIEVKVECYET